MAGVARESGDPACRTPCHVCLATDAIEHTTSARIGFGASRVTMPTLFSWLSCLKGQLSAYPSLVQAAYESPMTSYAIGIVT